MNKELFNKIKLVGFPEDQYYREATDKKQIYIHHTVSPNSSVTGDLQHWISSKSRIATHVIIGGDGTIHQCFSSKYWAHHLGVKSVIFNKLNLPNINKQLNKGSLSIELDSLGPVYENGHSVAYGAGCKAEVITSYPEEFRGFKNYEAYTPEQLKSLKELLSYWCDKYNIDKTYNEDMWDISKDALKGKSGIWTHVSVRPDKSDCHPSPGLIEILKSL